MVDKKLTSYTISSFALQSTCTYSAVQERGTVIVVLRHNMITTVKQYTPKPKIQRQALDDLVL